jgi:hypothetical protein
MTGKILKINWLWLVLALVLPLVAVTLFMPKPVEGA